MAVREILLLGNENLYKVCKEVSRDNIEKARRIVDNKSFRTNKDKAGCF